MDQYTKGINAVNDLNERSLADRLLRVAGIDLDAIHRQRAAGADLNPGYRRQLATYYAPIRRVLDERGFPATPADRDSPLAIPAGVVRWIAAQVDPLVRHRKDATMTAPEFPSVRCHGCGETFNHDDSLIIQGGAKGLELCSPGCAIAVANDLLESALPVLRRDINYDRLREVRARHWTSRGSGGSLEGI